MCSQLFSPQTMLKQAGILLETFADSAINLFLWQLKMQGLDEEKQSI